MLEVTEDLLQEARLHALGHAEWLPAQWLGPLGSPVLPTPGSLLPAGVGRVQVALAKISGDACFSWAHLVGGGLLALGVVGVCRGPGWARFLGSVSVCGLCMELGHMGGVGRTDQETQSDLQSPDVDASPCPALGM